MSNEKNRIGELIPQSLLEIAVPFVDLLKKYYEFMNLDNNPSHIINRDAILRDVTQATDFFLNRVYAEVGQSFYLNKDNVETNAANILENLRILYNAKGSLESIKVLFRIVFGEEVDVWLPRDFIFKSSAGTLIRDYSITAILTQGDPFQIVGEYADVVTNISGLPEQKFQTEIIRIEKIDNTYYRLFITKESIAILAEGSTFSFQDTIFTVVTTLSDITYNISGGSNFRVGQSYDIHNFIRNGSQTYITSLNSNFATYYTNQTFERRYISSDPLKKYDTETVVIKSYTDGLRIEEITRGSDSFKVLQYGQNTIKIVENLNGSKEYLYDTDLSVPIALSPLIDWDTVLTELGKITEGDTDGSLYTFLTTDGGEGFARGDINNSGSITLDDVEILLRRLMSYKVDSSHTTWIKDVIEADLLLISYPMPTTGTGQRGELRVQSVDGSAILTSKISNFGESYPDYFISFFENGGDYSVQIFESNFIARSSGYYVDNQGETSEATIRLQDNFFYQDLSYVIRTGVKYEEFENIIYKTVHPAGMKPFGELTISQQLELTTTISNAISIYYNRLFYDLTQFLETVNKVITKDLNIQNQTDDYIIPTDGIPTNEIEKQIAVDYIRLAESGQISLLSLYVNSGYFVDDFGYVGSRTINF